MQTSGLGWAILINRPVLLAENNILINTADLLAKTKNLMNGPALFIK